MSVISIANKDKDPVGIYLFKVNNRNSRTLRESCPKLAISLASFHCVKGVQIPSFFWSVFSRIHSDTEKYG